MSKGKSYEVGYGKPPKHSQFKKGHSGNQSGRPKGAVNKVTEEGLYAMVESEASRMVTVREGDRVLTMTMARVVLRNLMSQAAKNNTRAMALVIEQLKVLEEQQLTKAAQQRRAQSGEIQAILESMNIEQIQTFRKMLKVAWDSSSSPPKRPLRNKKSSAFDQEWDDL